MREDCYPPTVSVSLILRSEPAPWQVQDTHLRRSWMTENGCCSCVLDSCCGEEQSRAVHPPRLQTVIVKSKPGNQRPHLFEPFCNLMLSFETALKQHEPPPARAHDFPSQSSSLTSLGIQFIDAGVADFGRHLFLAFPGCIQKISKII